MALTFVRTSELIGARWDEFDFENAEWRIPAHRMKMKTLHIVPLAPETIEVLRTLQIVSGQSVLLFPGERDHEKPMSNNTILGALKRMGYQGRMTGHGFRGIASTVLHQQGLRRSSISYWRSAALRAPDWAGATPMASSARRTQLTILVTWQPNCLASSAGFLPARTSSTICSRNYAGYGGLGLGISDSFCKNNKVSVK